MFELMFHQRIYVSSWCFISCRREGCALSRLRDSLSKVSGRRGRGEEGQEQEEGRGEEEECGGGQATGRPSRPLEICRPLQISASARRTRAAVQLCLLSSAGVRFYESATLNSCKMVASAATQLCLVSFADVRFYESATLSSCKMVTSAAAQLC